MTVSINIDSSKPIYEQLKEQIIRLIIEGKLTSDTQLPSVRQLSSDLGINMHTVSKVYNILEKEGFVIINKKKGAFVAMDSKKIASTYSVDDLQEDILLKAMIFNKIGGDVDKLLEQIGTLEVKQHE